ncbi:MAG TPA: hypothetical protein VHT52_18455 [Stellaceae bacterium]|nr:hypothetical protein [Stellaceae bacterium]
MSQTRGAAAILAADVPGTGPPATGLLAGIASAYARPWQPPSG